MSAGRWTGLLVVLALVAALLAGMRGAARRTPIAPDVQVLTVAHRSLETGFRRGLTAVVASYEARHPGVKVEVIEVPGSVWAQWLITKLVGGMAPDLVQIGLPPGEGLSSQAFDELLGRHFRPLRAEMTRPNPYAAGSAWAHVPWRQTFGDGLMWPPSYSLTNFEVYGIPFTTYTTRLVYNRALLQDVTGRDEPPADYREFRALCDAIQTYERRTGRPLVPIAAARNTGQELMSTYFSSVTQWLRVELDPHRQFTLYPTDTLRAALGGGFGFDRPEVRAGLELAREVGLHCTPGFTQLQRDSAVFQFVHGQALMMLGSPADLATLREQTTFPIGVMRIPWPTADDPVYGRFVMGPIDESQGRLQNSFGVTQGSPRAALAVDFLQYATSPEGADVFARASRLLPSVTHVAVPDEVASFWPEEAGYPPGLPWGLGRPELIQVFDRHVHRLLSPGGSVDAFVTAVKAELPPAAFDAAHGFQRSWLRSIRQRDTALGAYTWLMAEGDDRERVNAAERWGVTLDNDSQADAHFYILEAYLRRPEPLPRMTGPRAGTKAEATDD